MIDLNLKLSYTIILSVLVLMMISCGESETGQSTENSEPAKSYEDFEAHFPTSIQQFDHIDTLYYSFIGLNTFATDDGGLILPVWGPSTIVRTNMEGTEVLAKTSQGRGPGELLDVGVPSVGENEIFVHDRNQQKIVVYNREDLSLIEEFIVTAYPEYQVRYVYSAFEDGNVFLELSNANLELDKMEDKLLIRYNGTDETYGELIHIKGRPHVPLVEVVNGRASMIREVPFSDNQFITPVPERKTLLLYDTRTDVIAEINADFDTLRTIAVDLPTEEISSDERTEFKAEIDVFPSADWSLISESLPDAKAPADAMLYNNDQIWLKSNLRGESDIWFVLNMDGEMVDVVHLPKGSFLTHVSEHHLGIRLDETNFALYENPIEP
jgi:hypothetical protein